MRNAIAAILLSAGMLAAPAAFAASGPQPCNEPGKACQNHGNPGDGHSQKQPQANSGPAHGSPPQANKGPSHPPQQQQAHQQPQKHSQKQAYHGPVKGQKLPPGNWGRPVPASAYHKHHLPPPARGREWVQVDGNYVLISIASGLIFSVIGAH